MGICNTHTGESIHIHFEDNELDMFKVMANIFSLANDTIRPGLQDMIEKTNLYNK
jgi:hypothetical protein